MKSRLFDVERDYEIVKKWWKDWGIEPLHPSFLSSRGVIISNHGVDVCCAWIYETDSDLCLLEWCISNKEAPRDIRKGCMDYMQKELSHIATKLGYGAIMAFVKNKNLNLIKNLEKGEFKNANYDMTNLIKTL